MPNPSDLAGEQSAVDYSGEPSEADIAEIRKNAAKQLRGQTLVVIDSLDKNEIGRKIKMPDQNDDWPEFVCEYQHAGRKWGINIMAPSEDDARKRLRAIGTTGQVMGELKMTIPVPFGSRIARWIRGKP